MPAVDAKHPLLPSLLSRLLDPESMHSADGGYHLREMIDAIRFDLEDLFNTRQSGVVVGRKYPELQNSIVTYGLPDLTYIDINNNAQCERICKTLATLVARSEPRIQNVRINVVKGEAVNGRNVRFHIEGQLAADPAPDLEFDTIFERGTGRTSVEAKGA